MTYYRNDIAFAVPGSGCPTRCAPRNPHTFLTDIASGPAAAAIAFKAQNQIATFFATNGAITVDPDALPPLLPAGFPPVFETPIILPLPEGLNFLP